MVQGFPLKTAPARRFPGAFGGRQARPFLAAGAPLKYE